MSGTQLIAVVALALTAMILVMRPDIASRDYPVYKTHLKERNVPRETKVTEQVSEVVEAD